ncbi:MAG: BON domain-containing protein [Piscinibacter sp.]|nr:BON domain-containing protein [Piscinibacter sp.]
MNARSQLWTPLAAALAGALMLSACGKEEQTAGQAVDETIAKVEQKSESAAQDLKQAATEAGDKVATVARDAAITTEINAELAKDNTLSALKINVDTSEGRVMLRGTAPDAASRERATRIAAGVKGVSSVENEMTLEPPQS